MVISIGNSLSISTDSLFINTDSTVVEIFFAVVLMAAVVVVVLVVVVVVVVVILHSNASFHRLQHVFISSLMSSLGHKKLSEISQFWNIVHIGSQFLVNENGCSIQN